MRLTLLLAAAAFVATAPAANVAAAQSADPVGNYTWSFDMQGNLVKGTLAVTRADSGYHAVFTSDHTQGDIVAKSVTVNDNHVVISSEGDFGQFTLDMTLGTTPIQATYKLDSNDGPSSGPITVERVEKSAPPAR
ncbi:MAG TPA: hypothetical protein VF159_07620 [Gemmatimonadaceae bacterium]